MTDVVAAVAGPDPWGGPRLQDIAHVARAYEAQAAAVARRLSMAAAPQ